MIKPNKKVLAMGGSLVVAVAAVIGWPSEGERQTAYRDTGGVSTVCFGHTGQDVVAGKYYSHSQCVKMYVQDAAKNEQYARNIVGANVWDKLPVEVRSSITDLTFNIGAGNLRKKTHIPQKLRQGQLFEACAEIATTHLTDSAGHRLQGLVGRRQAESQMCMDGIQ